MSNHPPEGQGMQLDEVIAIRLDWQVIAKLAVKATILQTSFEGMIEHAMKEGIQRIRTHSLSRHQQPMHAPMPTITLIEHHQAA